MSETENRITNLSPVGLAFPDHPAAPLPRRMCQGDKEYEVYQVN